MSNQSRRRVTISSLIPPQCDGQLPPCLRCLENGSCSLGRVVRVINNNTDCLPYQMQMHNTMSNPLRPILAKRVT
ncbi:hypothetical protein BJX99DRAFT_238433 [Aspergillus californicus]